MATNPFDNLWLYRTDEKGRMVFFVSGLQKLFEGSFGGFSDHPFVDLIEFDKLYKWPQLKVGSYRILINPHRISFVTDGKVWRYENAMYLSEVKGTFPNGANSLASYINQKINDLYLLNIFKARRLSQDNFSKNYLSSKEISQVMSSSGKLDKYWNIEAGSPDIFESNDLLDQLFIYVLIKYSRWGNDGHTVAIKTLLSLLEDKINYRVRASFQYVREDDTEYLVSEMRDLVFQVIKSDRRLKRKGDHFELNKDYSLGFFLAAPTRPKIGSKKVYISKIQEHLADYRDRIERNRKTIPKSILTGEENDVTDDDVFGEDETSNPKKIVQEQDLQRGYMRLPPQEKLLFQQLVEGKTLEKIGRQLKLTKSAVWKRVDKMKKRLRIS